MAKHPKRLCETAQLAASVPCDHDGSTDRVGGWPSEHNVNLETNQLRCESWEPLDSRVRASVLDGDVSILGIAELTQPLPEGVELHSRFGGFQRTGYHQTNPRDFRRWLGIHGQRQGGRRAAEQRQKLASS